MEKGKKQKEGIKNERFKKRSEADPTLKRGD